MLLSILTTILIIIIILCTLVQFPKRRAGRKEFVHLSKMITENDQGATSLEHIVNYIYLYTSLIEPTRLLSFLRTCSLQNQCQEYYLKKDCKDYSQPATTKKKNEISLTYYGYDYSTSLNTLRIGRSSFTILFFWKSGTFELFKSFMCQIKILYSPASSLRKKLVFQSWQQFPPHVAFSLDSSSIQHQAFWG